MILTFKKQSRLIVKLSGLKFLAEEVPCECYINIFHFNKLHYIHAARYQTLQAKLPTT